MLILRSNLVEILVFNVNFSAFWVKKIIPNAKNVNSYKNTMKMSRELYQLIIILRLVEQFLLLEKAPGRFALTGVVEGIDQRGRIQRSDRHIHHISHAPCSLDRLCIHVFVSFILNRLRRTN